MKNRKTLIALLLFVTFTFANKSFSNPFITSSGFHPLRWIQENFDNPLHVPLYLYGNFRQKLHWYKYFNPLFEPIDDDCKRLREYALLNEFESSNLSDKSYYENNPYNPKHHRYFNSDPKTRTHRRRIRFSTTFVIIMKQLKKFRHYSNLQRKEKDKKGMEIFKKELNRARKREGKPLITTWSECNDKFEGRFNDFSIPNKVESLKIKLKN